MTAPAQPDDFQRMQATVFDWTLVMHDDRTRAEPFAVLVDAINTQKIGGGRHVNPSVENANRALRDAVEFLSADEINPLGMAMGVVYALFAIRCMKRQSPVMLMPPCGCTAKAVDEFKADGDPLFRAVRGLVALGGNFYPNDEHAARKLSVARSQAWSADVPGIAILVDCEIQ